MIIVGLGNPGKEYEKTRHNVGFMFVDELAKTYNLEFKLDKKLQCMKTEVLIKGEKHIIIKPIKLIINKYPIILIGVKYVINPVSFKKFIFIPFYTNKLI